MRNGEISVSYKPGITICLMGYGCATGSDQAIALAANITSGGKGADLGIESRWHTGKAGPQAYTYNIVPGPYSWLSLDFSGKGDQAACAIN